MKLYKIKHIPTGLFVGKNLDMYTGKLNKKGRTWRTNPMNHFHKLQFYLDPCDIRNNPKPYPKKEFELIEFEVILFEKAEKNTQSLIDLGKEVNLYASKYRGSGMYDEILLAIEFGYSLK